MISSAPSWALGCDACKFGILPGGAYCDCQAGESQRTTAKRQAAEEAMRRADDIARIEQARQSRYEALIPADFRGRTAASLASMEGKRDGAKAAAEWMATGQHAGRRGILFTGGWGTGKSTFLYAIAAKLHEDRRAVMAVNYGEFLKAIQAEYGKDGGQAEEMIGQALNAQVLLIDDLGTHGREIETADRAETVFRIFHYRMENDLPVIATSNFRMDALAEHFGGRVGSRVKKCCAEVIVGGVDLRGL